MVKQNHIYLKYRNPKAFESLLESFQKIGAIMGFESQEFENYKIRNLEKEIEKFNICSL